MKKIILVFAILIHSCLIFAAKVPNWILDVDSEYPKDIYLARLGTGTTLENARADALGLLAGYFNAQILVDTKATNIMNNKDNNVSKEQNINQEINVVSETSLVGVEYSNSFFNKKEKKYYIVAYLNREEAWKNLEDKLNVLFEKYETFQDMAEKSADLITKFKYSKKASNTGEEFLNEVYKGFIINPAKRKFYKPKITEINLKIEENSQIIVPVKLKINGDCENIIKNLIVNEFKKAGFFIDSDSANKNSYLLCVDIKSNEKLDNEIYFVFPELSIELLDSAKTRKFYSFEKKYSKTAGFSLNQTQKKAFSKIADELNSVLSEDVKKSFLEN